MRRRVADSLVAWKEESGRRPLLLRGARQVGKTWAVLDFAERSFGGRIHVLDFEREPGLRRLFAPDRVPSRILDALQVRRDVSVVAGRDLLFLDEVQACPKAIVSLRYFFEEMPELHVIAAGSLAELELGGLSFPVGRIHPVTMHPMTLMALLWATGAERAAELVAAGPASLPEEVHGALLAKVRQYLFVGGMHQLLKEYPRCAPGLVLSEWPYAELPEQGSVFVPLYYAGELSGWAA